MTTTATPRAAPRAVPDGFAVASLILGILPVVPAACILAIIFGFVSRGRARRSGETPSRMANWGIGLGFAAIAIFVIVIVVLVAAHSTDPTQQFINCQNANIQNGTNNTCP